MNLRAGPGPRAPHAKENSMLAQGTYDADYLAGCRAQIGADIAAFDNARIDAQGSEDVLGDLELSYFAALLLSLEMRFVDRPRDVEGTDGNPLNEVRVIARSLMTNGGRMLADASLPLDPARTVLGLRPGDDIQLRYDDFVRLSDAFFTELEARYSPE
ncbi:hypothetical protein [Cellulomonas gilvus]|nr:hypothetical protein [Cellulomonas gilvus]